MAKKNNNSSLDRMKFLFEYQFKQHTREEAVEQPVKFNEIGDKYQAKPKSDYPSYDQYLDEVILDEDEPVKEPQDSNGPPAPEGAQPVQPQPASQGEPMPSAAPVPQPSPMPAPEAQPATPAPAPAAPEQAPVVPQPTIPQDSQNDLDMKLNSQISKTEELLSMISNIEQKLGAIDNVSAKINHVAKEVEDIKNPSLDTKLDNIAKQSYPYNVKLNDYFEWNDEEVNDKPETEFSVKIDDLNSYNTDDVKNSFY